MARSRLTLLRIAGVPLQLDVTWILLVVLLTWSFGLTLARSLPPGEGGLGPDALWGLALLMALAFCGCLVLHELGHVLVGKRCGVRFRSVTLFLFGGVAELDQEPPSARAELGMALAGPAVSGVLAAGFGLLTALCDPAGVAAMLLWQLAVLNALLAGFNLLPAFPLDGGRVLRALLWARWGDQRQATAVCASAGQAFASGMLVFGALSLLAGYLVFGLWWLVLGWFLHAAALSSYQQAVVRAVLTGEPVRRFMTENVTSVTPDLDIEHLVDQYVYHSHHQIYPVRTNGRLLGYVTPQAVKQVPRAEWPQHRVAEIMTADCTPVQISPDTDALDALARMQRTGQTRLLVAEGGTLVGVLTLKDLLDFLSVKLELEEVQ